MHILVTRPEPDAASLRQRLEALGHRVTAAPMLSIELAPEAIGNLRGVAALIATSRNGLRALAASPRMPAAVRLPVFAVGKATAAAARAMGFATVIEGPGTARALAGVIAKHMKAEDGTLLHLAGDRLAFDLKTALEAAGFAVRQPMVYRQLPAADFAPPVATAIRDGAVDAVILMSPRTARVYASLVATAGLADGARRAAYVCLSPAVAAALAGLEPVRTEVAASPGMDSLMDAVTVLSSKFA